MRAAMKTNYYGVTKIGPTRGATKIAEQLNALVSRSPGVLKIWRVCVIVKILKTMIVSLPPSARSDSHRSSLPNVLFPQLSLIVTIAIHR